MEIDVKEESKKLKKILGKNCTAVCHIGSTSVRNLVAKPIIYIMPVVKDISLVDAYDAEFEAIGYECKGEFGISGQISVWLSLGVCFCTSAGEAIGLIYGSVKNKSKN